MISDKLKKLPREFAVYGAGQILLRGLGLITLPIYSRVFSPDEFGIIVILNTFIALMTPLMGCGSDTVYARFYFEAGDDKARNDLATTWFGFLLLWSVFLALTFSAFSPYISGMLLDEGMSSLLIPAALAVAVATLGNGLLSEALRLQFRAVSESLTAVLAGVVTVVCILVAILVLDLGVVGVLMGMLAGQLVSIPIRVCFLNTRFTGAFSPELLRRLLAYGIPIIPVSLAYWIFQLSDRFMLKAMSTMEQVGLYGTAATLAGVVTMASVAFSQAWGPHVFRSYEEDSESARVEFGRIMTLLVAYAGGGVVVLSLFARELLVVLVAGAYWGAVDGVSPLLLGALAFLTTRITANGMYLKKKPGYIGLYAWMAALLNVTLNFLWIPRWGMVGASWATAISFVFLTCAFHVRSQALWPVIYESRRLAVLVGAIVAMTLVSIRMHAWPVSWTGATVKVGLAALYILSAVYTTRRRAEGNQHPHCGKT